MKKISVEIYDINENTNQPSVLCIGVSSERYFTLYWEKALADLGITSLGNGVWLEHKDRAQIFADFRRIRVWAEEKLPATEAEYMISHIDLILEKLPDEWSSQLPRLWMG